GHLCAAELKAPAADGTHQIVVRAVGHHRHEVEADPLLRPDVVEEHLVVTVRADGRRDLAQVVRLTRPEPENHHAAIEAWASGRGPALAARTPATSTVLRRPPPPAAA